MQLTDFSRHSRFDASANYTKCIVLNKWRSGNLRLFFFYISVNNGPGIVFFKQIRQAELDNGETESNLRKNSTLRIGKRAPVCRCVSDRKRRPRNKQIALVPQCDLQKKTQLHLLFPQHLKNVALRRMIFSGFPLKNYRIKP